MQLSLACKKMTGLHPDTVKCSRLHTSVKGPFSTVLAHTEEAARTVCIECEKHTFSYAGALCVHL